MSVRTVASKFCGVVQAGPSFTPKATGQRTTGEEVGIYTVKNDKITREQFFYDGEH